MPMDLVFVLKWVKSVIGCLFFVFQLSGMESLLCWNLKIIWTANEKHHRSVDCLRLQFCNPRFESQPRASMLFSFLVKFVIYLSCEKNENTKEAWSIFKKPVEITSKKVFTVPVLLSSVPSLGDFWKFPTTYFLEK